MGVGLIPAWRVVGASVEGSRHRADGRPCQDAHAVRSLPCGAVVVAVADGAGSAPRADTGAQIAALTAADTMAAAIEPRLPAGKRAWRQLLAGTLVAARIAVDGTARNGGTAVTDLASTLTVVVITDAVVATAQVGDGTVVVATDGCLTTIGDTERSEYLNETTFLTSAAWAACARLEVISSENVRGVAVFSDGLERLALDMARRVPHAPFFTPLYQFAADEHANPGDLAAFLASDRVCAHTDDDKTLVLAVRA